MVTISEGAERKGRLLMAELCPKGVYWIQVKYIYWDDGLKEAVALLMDGGSLRIETSTYQNDMTTYHKRDDVPKYADTPALLVELKFDKNVDTVLSQIRRQDYPARKLEHYKGNILLVGIDYDKDITETRSDFKHHFW